MSSFPQHQCMRLKIPNWVDHPVTLLKKKKKSIQNKLPHATSLGEN